MVIIGYPVLIFGNRSSVDTGLMSHKKREKKNMGLIEWIIENWFSVLITCIVIPLLFILVNYLWYNYISVLKIAPKVKDINCTSGSYRKEIFYVYLTNNSSNPIYDVNVTAYYPKEVNVSVHPEKGQTEMIPIGNLSMGTSFSIIGYDNKNLGFSQTIINNLAPKEIVKFKVEVDKKDYYNNFKLTTKATFNSKTPKPILSSR